jgi:hypothetical protein
VKLQRPASSLNGAIPGSLPNQAGNRLKTATQPSGDSEN